MRIDVDKHGFELFFSNVQILCRVEKRRGLEVPHCLEVLHFVIKAGKAHISFVVTQNDLSELTLPIKFILRHFKE